MSVMVSPGFSCSAYLSLAPRKGGHQSPELAAVAALEVSRITHFELKRLRLMEVFATDYYQIAVP